MENKKIRIFETEREARKSLWLVAGWGCPRCQGEMSEETNLHEKTITQFCPECNSDETRAISVGWRK